MKWQIVYVTNFYLKDRDILFKPSILRSPFFVLFNLNLLDATLTEDTQLRFVPTPILLKPHNYL